MNDQTVTELVPAPETQVTPVQEGNKEGEVLETVHLQGEAEVGSPQEHSAELNNPPM